MTKQTKIFISVLLSCTMLLLLFIPSFASDEPSYGGQSEAPTDLTGTVWLLNTTLDFSVITVSDNHFPINFETTDGSYTNFTSFRPNRTYSQLYYWNGDNNGNTRVYGSGSWINESFRSIRFTGGDNVTNSTLITFLMSNGRWLNPPEPEPIPTYTIQPNYYQIKLQPDSIPDDVGFFEYGGQFIYEGETYRSLRFARVSSLLTNVYLYDDDGNQVVIKGQTASNDGWFSGRNITLVSPITTENEEAYTYFTENLSATEQSPFDLVTYMVSGFFKALDNFYLFFDFTLLDFIFVICGLLGAIWFLKLLAGG